MPVCPETQYYLEIQVIWTEEGGAMSPPPNTWQAPVVKDMLQGSKSGLTEVTLMGPGWAILFYERQVLGEGLILGEA